MASVDEYLIWIGQVLRKHTEGSRTKAKTRQASFLALTPETLEARAQNAAKAAKTPEERRLVASIWFEAAVEREGCWVLTQFRPDEIKPLTQYDLAMGMCWLARGLNLRLYPDDIFALRLGAEMLFTNPNVQHPHARDINLYQTLLLCRPLAGIYDFIPIADNSIKAVMEGVKLSGNVELTESLKHVISRIKSVSPEMGEILTEMWREVE